jgi:hypothetical protein
VGDRGIVGPRSGAAQDRRHRRTTRMPGVSCTSSSPGAVGWAASSPERSSPGARSRGHRQGPPGVPPAGGGLPGRGLHGIVFDRDTLEEAGSARRRPSWRSPAATTPTSCRRGRRASTTASSASSRGSTTRPAPDLRALRHHHDRLRPLDRRGGPRAVSARGERVEGARSRAPARSSSSRPDPSGGAGRSRGAVIEPGECVVAAVTREGARRAACGGTAARRATRSISRSRRATPPTKVRASGRRRWGIGER